MNIWIKAATYVACALTPGLSLAEGDKNVLSIGGSVTEIIYALGEGGRVIARDTTSSYPAQVKALPDVGYLRALSPEGVLAVSPGLIIAEDGAGPPETIEVLAAADIPFFKIPDGYSTAGIVAKIMAVGEALDVEAAAIALASDVMLKLQNAQSTAAAQAGDTPKRVLFILSTQAGRIMASGQNTAANGIIELAGGVNVITQFEGYKPLSDEAVIAAAPDVILMMDRSGAHNSDDAELFAMPAIATTPAARTRSVVRMNGLYLLGFGPRTADAVIDLTAALYAN
jgi:iron complex transport system substrate-binding protein